MHRVFSRLLAVSAVVASVSAVACDMSPLANDQSPRSSAEAPEKSTHRPEANPAPAANRPDARAYDWVGRNHSRGLEFARRKLDTMRIDLSSRAARNAFAHATVREFAATVPEYVEKGKSTTGPHTAQGLSRRSITSNSGYLIESEYDYHVTPADASSTLAQSGYSALAIDLGEALLSAPYANDPRAEFDRIEQLALQGLSGAEADMVLSSVAIGRDSWTYWAPDVSNSREDPAVPLVAADIAGAIVGGLFGGLKGAFVGGVGGSLVKAIEMMITEATSG
ncbi:MAG: hypothetical protein AVDCRST_MAG68-4882 [uncultured Gemmatimonadetes bacterium]|uniref:Lipoprotein n=1 Tax=uncultured Gemmatimonadota bacterium TaxID=203437 RepID=A0A6J4MR54_9BACT|nr:MAG: hypothetical protein AVDCRST_MAG68-4882 [uncultured Gemmatimonadota bacterium]